MLSKVIVKIKQEILDNYQEISYISSQEVNTMNDQLLEALKNWAKLNEILPGLGEVEVKELLDYELQHDNRRTLVERLHQRYNTLRVARERGELLGKN